MTRTEIIAELQASICYAKEKARKEFQISEINQPEYEYYESAIRWSGTAAGLETALVLLDGSMEG